MNSELLKRNEKYEIRMALESEREILVKFIDTHWRKNHIFVQSKELLDWQHLDSKNKRYNFVIGINKDDGEIHGALGFIPLSQFDDEIETSRLGWMAIWKVQEVARGFKLGRSLMTYMEVAFKLKVTSTVAASTMTLPMYKARGFQVGQLSHFYLVNPNQKKFELISMNSNQETFFAATNYERKLIPAASAELFKVKDIFFKQLDFPQKSPSYIVNRYLNHPIYEYETYFIKEHDQTIGLIVTRICRHSSACAIRIVDFIGPSSSLVGLYPAWVDLLDTHKAEYIDFYNAGINEHDLKASGFIRRGQDGNVIIPNYFEPFVKSNVEIDYVINLPENVAFRVVKGDSDQDRPNSVGVR